MEDQQPSPSSGLHHTDSISASSLKSHDSVRVVGAHPLGSLRVCNEPGPVAPSDAVVLLDIPAGFVVGCDTISLTSRDGIRGFADLPPGPHLVWVAANDSAAMRHGFWLHAARSLPAHPGTVHVRQWDGYNEVLGHPASHAEESFNQKDPPRTDLISYPNAMATAARQPDKPEPFRLRMPSFVADFSPAVAWTKLASVVSPELLDRVVGKGHGEWSVTTLDIVKGEASLAEERKLYSSISACQLRFLFSQDAKTFDPGVTGRERTEQALDPTAHILSVLGGSRSKLVLLKQAAGTQSRGAFTDADIIGEFQFAFLTGLLLGNASCCDQWWYFLTKLLFRAYALPLVRPGLAQSLVRTFLAQLVYIHRYVEDGNLWDTPTDPPYSQASLQKALVTYRKRLNEQLAETGDGASPQQLDAKLAFDQLEAWLSHTGWDLETQYVRDGMVTLEDGEQIRLRLKDDEADAEDDEGEYAPLVVDMGEQSNAAAGMVRWD